MVLAVDETIVAIGTPAGPAARGVVRISGPQTLACLSRCFIPDEADCSLAAINACCVLPGAIPIEHTSSLTKSNVPGDLFLWPNQQSYTRQPSAEFHTIGSPPLLDAVLASLCGCGARLAEPGEFTLRAFLAGRIDLPQAEAVLGVVDARSQADLDTALHQLAGGLSQPLATLREQLVYLLAELEAGLDFAEEVITFLSAEQLTQRLLEGQQTVDHIRQQLSERGTTNNLPKVVLTGPPNVGKSSLFNALVHQFEAKPSDTQALVSPRAGTTRDYLTATINCGGTLCDLVDTAGQESVDERLTIAGAAQKMSGGQTSQASLLIACVDATCVDADADLQGSSPRIIALTKGDLIDETTRKSLQRKTDVTCSSVTGEGLSDLFRLVGQHLRQDTTHAVAATAARCGDSLRLASASLAEALNLVQRGGGEELVAAELRTALHELACVVGAVVTDDLLDRIFSQFCIGK